MSNENQKLEQMPTAEYEKLTDVEKDELWDAWIQESNYNSDTKHHLNELRHINRTELNDADWIIWDRVDKNYMDEKEFEQIEKQQRDKNSGLMNQSRANLYAMLRNRLLGKLTEEKFKNKI